MQINLSKTSSGRRNPSKIVELDLEDNFVKPITCEKCKSPEYTGFTTSFGAFRRCVKCNHEWPMGGISSMLNLSKEEREELRDYQNTINQDEAYNRAMSLAEDMERVEDVRSMEKFSGSGVNRSLWNDYLRQWDGFEGME